MHSTIFIKDIRLHAYHGVLPQEREVGNDYVVSLTVDYPIMKVCLSDDVTDTMNYADAADVIHREMSIQSNLLENVAYRICKAILDRFPEAQSATVSLTKIAPPMQADCAGAGVTLRLNQSDMTKENERPQILVKKI